VVGLKSNGGVEINPPPERHLPAGAELILIGTVEDEERFLRQFGAALESAVTAESIPSPGRPEKAPA
jgi:hypothetical protein